MARSTVLSRLSMVGHFGPARSAFRHRSRTGSNCMAARDVILVRPLALRGAVVAVRGRCDCGPEM